MSYADVNGTSLWYQEHGAGEPLILLHGGLGMGEMWAPILPPWPRDAGSSRSTCRPTVTLRTWTARCGTRRWPTTWPP